MRSNSARWIKRLRKYHKWPGIILTFFVLQFAVSGILLNHRNLISKVDISRKWMPPGYRYNNWNLSGLKSALPVGKDSLLIYGNIGVWLVTDDLKRFQDGNAGFPEGIDKRKIGSLLKFRNQLVAGTQFGLFYSNLKPLKWTLFQMPSGEERITDLTVKGDTLLVLTRNFLYQTTDLVHLERLHMPLPAGYSHKAGLFLTLWELHSGELFGFAGKLFVDLLGLVLIFLSVTGLLHFLFPKLIKRLKNKNRSYERPLSLKRWNLKWHNLTGYLFAVFLVINTTAGMFLRPPLLIPIFSTQVGILPFTHLDTDNPWQDKLRRITWSAGMKRYLIHTSDGFFTADEKLESELSPVFNQPVVSIMGCNVLEPADRNEFLVGSFSGLFRWDPVSGESTDYFTGLPAEQSGGMSRPVSSHMVSGFLKDDRGRSYWIDYNQGILPTQGGKPFPAMPAKIVEQSPISLWNAALEMHTGRIFEHLIGPLYLLYVPLMGLTLLLVLISGFFIWWMGYRKSGRMKNEE